MGHLASFTDHGAPEAPRTSLRNQHVNIDGTAYARMQMAPYRTSDFGTSRFENMAVERARLVTVFPLPRLVEPPIRPALARRTGKASQIGTPGRNPRHRYARKRALEGCSRGR
jgi:hypothetical protein